MKFVEKDLQSVEVLRNTLKKNLVWYNYCFGVSQYCKKNLKLLPQTSQTELIPVVKFVEKDLRSVEVRIILLTNTWFFNSCFIAE